MHILLIDYREDVVNEPIVMTYSRCRWAALLYFKQRFQQDRVDDSIWARLVDVYEHQIASEMMVSLSYLSACKAHSPYELAAVKPAVSSSECHFQCASLLAFGQCAVFSLALACTISSLATI